MKNKQEIEVINNKSQNSPMCDSVAHLEEGEVQALQALWQLPPGMDLRELASQAATDISVATYRAFRAGAALLVLKAQCLRGEFLPLCAELNIDRFRAAECMRLAETHLRMPEKERARYAALPKTKALMIASLDEEAQEAILGSDNFEEWMALPRAVLARQLKAARDKNAQLDNKLYRQEMELEAERKGKERATVLTETDRWRQDLRMESLALADAATLCIADLERQLEQLLEEHRQPANSDEAAQDRALCTSFTANTYHLFCQAQALHRAAIKALESRASVREGDAPVFTRDDANAAWRRRETMVALHGEKRAEREWTRALGLKQGRGRPPEPPPSIKQRLKKGAGDE